MTPARLAAPHPRGIGEPRPGRRKTRAEGRALAYLRVSTLAQQKDGKNLDSQLDEIRAYCVKKGYTLDAEDVFKDIISGSRFDRQDYYKLLERVERGDASVIVSYEVARIGRNGLDNAWLLVKAKEHGIRIETCTGGRDYTSDPESEFMYDMLSAVAKYERNAILYRMTRGKRHSHKRGGWVHGAAPYGYTTTGPRGARELVPVEPAASHVREAFTRYAEGESTLLIGEWFQRLGARPNNKHGGRWDSKTIGSLLQNPSYIGKVAWGEDIAQGRHEPIVDMDLWERVQARRAAMRARFPGRPKKDRDEA